MTLAYLTAAAAQTRLIASEIYSETEAPSKAALEIVLEAIEIEVDAWLRWRMAPSDYAETILTDSSGIALLRHYPVLAVSKVEFLNRPLSVNWQTGTSVKCDVSFNLVRITYRAGYDPIPPIVPQRIFQVLQTVLDKTGTTGDVSFLNEPIQEVSSISLPGGLRKSFRAAGASSSQSSAKSAETLLDKMLRPLEQYRRGLVL